MFCLLAALADEFDIDIERAVEEKFFKADESRTWNSAAQQIAAPDADSGAGELGRYALCAATVEHAAIPPSGRNDGGIRSDPKSSSGSRPSVHGSMVLSRTRIGGVILR